MVLNNHLKTGIIEMGATKSGPYLHYFLSKRRIATATTIYVYDIYIVGCHYYAVYEIDIINLLVRNMR